MKFSQVLAGLELSSGARRLRGDTGKLSIERRNIPVSILWLIFAFTNFWDIKLRLLEKLPEEENKNILWPCFLTRTPFFLTNILIKRTNHVYVFRRCLSREKNLKACKREVMILFPSCCFRETKIIPHLSRNRVFHSRTESYPKEINQKGFDATNLLNEIVLMRSSTDRAGGMNHRLESIIPHPVDFKFSH